MKEALQMNKRDPKKLDNLVSELINNKIQIKNCLSGFFPTIPRNLAEHYKENKNRMLVLLSYAITCFSVFLYNTHGYHRQFKQ